MKQHFSSQISNRGVKPYHSILLYCGCSLLVVGFVHFYSLYAFLLARFGKGFIAGAPLILPFFLLLIIILVLSRAQFSINSRSYKWPWIAGGMLLLAIGLLIPDPNYVVKRIHVTEYLALSLLVTYTLSHHLNGMELLFYATLLAALLGVHDEFLQGFHPSRTFGLRDICVNSVAAFGGNCIWYGMGLFRKINVPGRSFLSHPILKWYLLWLFLSVLMMVVPFINLKYSAIPTWVYLPLSSSLLFWCCSCLTIYKQIGHGALVLSSFSFMLLFYPVIINVCQIPFN